MLSSVTAKSQIFSGIYSTLCVQTVPVCEIICTCVRVSVEVRHRSLVYAFRMVYLIFSGNGSLMNLETLPVGLAGWPVSPGVDLSLP